MLSTRLVAGTYPTGVNLDLKEDIPLSINMSMADVREFDKRQGSYSKTITLYGTKNNNDFFEHMYEVNIKTLNFNPNVKTAAEILQDGISILRGDLQLREVRKIWDNGTEMIEYDVSIYGNIASLFIAMGDSKLEDLNFNEYNHTYDRTNQKLSWDTSIKINNVTTAFQYGRGYVYPLIDYGYNGFATNYFHVNAFRPALFAKEYWDAIFTAYGYTYTSTFLTGNTFKRLIVPHNGDALYNSVASLKTYEVYAGRLVAGTAQNLPLTYVSPGWRGSVSGNIANDTNLVIHRPDDDTTSPFYDNGNWYNTTTAAFTVPSPTFNVANYNFQGKVKFNIKGNFPATAVSSTGQIAMWLILAKSTNGGASWYIEAGAWHSDILANKVLTTSYQTAEIDFSFNNIVTSGTNQFRIVCNILPSNQPSNLKFWTGAGGGGSEVTSGTTSLDVQNAVNGYFNPNLFHKTLLDGQTLNFNDAIPVNIKQRDFIKDIMNIFHLYMDVDKSNPKNYLIEPRPDFFLSTGINWTDKLAIDQPISIRPMGDLKGKSYIWKYKEDKDYYNTLYQNEYKETYGQKTKTITTDFLKDEIVNELKVFSATPIVDNPNNQIICPKIFDYDGTNVKRIKSNLRLLYYGGVKNVPNGWTYGSGYPVTNYTEYTYPYAGMPDDPLTTTLTLEFGVINKLYYFEPTAVYTDNNLYNAYYSEYINEISDRDSKIVTMWLHLTPSDINQFDFRKPVFIEDAYYLVNSISDYSPVRESLTKVELLKLKFYPAFVAASKAWTVLEANAGGGDGSTGWEKYGGAGGENGNTGAANNQLAGESINTQSDGAVLTGKAIYVGKDCYNISVVSCENVFMANEISGASILNSDSIHVSNAVSGLVLVNCEDITVNTAVKNFQGFSLSGKTITTADNDTVQFGDLTSAPLTDRDIIKRSNFTVTADYDTYYVDATSGAIAATITDVGTEIKIKKIDGSVNAVTIQDSNPGITIDGAGTKSLATQWHAVVLGYNSANTAWYIKASFLFT